jgi:hypothetical protein
MSTFTSEPGTKLGGRYRLEDRLVASGGWAAWKAIDEILARPVSVITFATGYPRLAEVVTAARAASRLTDTRLTQVFDVEDSWEHAYIVLEWPVGDTLTDLIEAGSLEPATGARIVAEVAGALSGAHAAGLAHLCLRPEAVRWTQGGGIKVTGTGIDAALAGLAADDPELADARGLGQLLYAVLTGLWPGPDSLDLPLAPLTDGHPRRPRQVRAGVPTALDDVAARALALPGRDAEHAFSSPSEVAGALTAAIPPTRVPPAATSGRFAQIPPGQDRYARTSAQHQVPSVLGGESGRWSSPESPRLADELGYGPDGLARRRSPVRLAAVTALVIVVVIGLSAGALHLFRHSPQGAHHGRSGPAASHQPSSSAVTTLTPVSAQGFDAANPNPGSDAGDENTDKAGNVLDGNPAGWATQQYYGTFGADFGNLKPGTGLILDMGKPVRVSSLTVQFGSVPGANVQIKVGDSNTRSPANLASMTTVASANDVSGSYTFTVSKPTTGQYLVIWFTHLPPMNGKQHGQAAYMAQVFSVTARGTS